MTLRARLAALGLVGILVPLAALLGVSAAVEESQTTRTGVDGVVTERTRGLSPWVPATAAALSLPAAAAAWWWAGRAVGPLRRITVVADEVQATSFDRRIGTLDGTAEVEALAASFDRMLDRLATSSQVQRHLVEDASHQLRTPLAVLLTGIDVALAEPAATADDLTEALTAARASAAHLRTVVEDLLTSAHNQRAASGGVAVDLAVLIQEAVDAHAAAAAAAGASIAVDAPTPVAADVDRGAVLRAVAALIDNAIRHSPSGGQVEVAAAIAPNGPSVSVTDQGQGVHPAELHRMFERYWSGPENDDGLGIGLAVVAQVGEAHGGVEVTSPVHGGAGTRITLHLGRRRAAPATADWNQP